jgi:hypothetical protein
MILKDKIVITWMPFKGKKILLLNWKQNTCLPKIITWI